MHLWVHNIAFYSIVFTRKTYIHTSGNVLEIWICGCRCILESSGSQNSIDAWFTGWHFYIKLNWIPSVCVWFGVRFLGKYEFHLNFSEGKLNCVLGDFVFSSFWNVENKYRSYQSSNSNLNPHIQLSNSKWKSTG